MSSVLRTNRGEILPKIPDSITDVAQRKFYNDLLSMLNGWNENQRLDMGVVNTSMELSESKDNGWIPVTDTWAYASATTITVPTGATTKYSVGDKIKLTQTTVKYFYIVGVAATTLTITGGTSYTLANAAITEISYSHADSPVGFPQRFAYTPTITSDSGTHTTITTSAYFSIVGREVFYSVTILVTDKGTAAGRIRFSLPVNAVIASYCQGAGRETDVTTHMLQSSIYGSTLMSVAKYDGTTPWVNNYRCWASIKYWI